MVAQMEVTVVMVVSYFESDRNLNTLIDFRYAQHFRAEHGKAGSKRNKTGAMEKI